MAPTVTRNAPARRAATANFCNGLGCDSDNAQLSRARQLRIFRCSLLIMTGFDLGDWPLSTRACGAKILTSDVCHKVPPRPASLTHITTERYDRCDNPMTSAPNPN